MVVRACSAQHDTHDILDRQAQAAAGESTLGRSITGSGQRSQILGELLQQGLLMNVAAGFFAEQARKRQSRQVYIYNTRYKQVGKQASRQAGNRHRALPQATAKRHLELVHSAIRAQQPARSIGRFLPPRGQELGSDADVEGCCTLAKRHVPDLHQTASLRHDDKKDSGDRLLLVEVDASVR